jgi:hypothetical protein
MLVRWPGDESVVVEVLPEFGFERLVWTHVVFLFHSGNDHTTASGSTSDQRYLVCYFCRA